MRIKLSIGEMYLAANTGTLRHIQSVQKGLEDKNGYDKGSWIIDIEGAAGELAAAKALGIYWGAGVNTFKKGGDVSGLEVRTRSKHEYDHLIRDDDSDESIFILVTGVSPNFEVVGWIRGKDAKKEEWRKSHGGRPPAYFVPKSELHSIESLKEMLQIESLKELLQKHSIESLKELISK